ncbi:serine protease [Pseudonocardiaceae bacterium YIM PH 21723]|nr:serine protease [Pseudonocardiaceae bacterium YIM PH 21723]
MRISRKALLALVSAAALATIGATTLPATSHVDTVAAEAAAAPSLAGTVALNNCSGSIIRFATSQDTDKAVMMTNGHCLESGMPGAGQVIVNKPSTRSATLLNATGGSLGTVKATSIMYGTMTDTDVALYQLSSTYAQIKALKFEALPFSASHPTDGTLIDIPSGYWKKTYQCGIEGFVYQLKEGAWTWKDSIRYGMECQAEHGSSGSPIVDRATRTVIGINNTGNDEGQRCTVNNPCEVDQAGNVKVDKGRSYGEQTYQINGCLGAGSTIDLNKAGCTLAKP